MDFIFDMETQDPDDFLTLILLCGHPQVHLKAITMVPGSLAQISLVKWLFRTYFPQYSSIPIGYFDIHCKHPSVSAWHYKNFGYEIPLLKEEEIIQLGNIQPAYQILYQMIVENPQIIVLTGASLKNIARTLEYASSSSCTSSSASTSAESETPHSSFSLQTIIIQGGFAGCNIIPEEVQLTKFKGLLTCPTFNLNGDIPAAKLVLSSPLIQRKYLVSKNICHSVTYNSKLNDCITTAISLNPNTSATSHLQMIQSVMSRYGGGEKKLHDPFAACCAINRSIGVWEEVEMYVEKGKKGYEWGARKVDYSTNVFIIVNYNRQAFLETFCENQ